jgi:hypothetical protein
MVIYVSVMWSMNGAMRIHLIACLACAACLLGVAIAAEDDQEFDLITGRAVGPVKLPAGARAFSGGTDEMGKLTISRDGRLAAGAGKDGKVRLFDIASAKLHSAIEADHDEISGISFSADGKSVFSSSDDKVKQWDVDSGKEVQSFGGHNGNVGSVLVSPDGKRMVTTDATGIHIWDLKTGKDLFTMTGHEVPKDIPTSLPLEISALAISADGGVLLTEANDETAKLWDTRSGKELRTLPNHDGSVAAVALSPDGALGISTRGNRTQWGEVDDEQPAGGRIRVWEVATGKVRRVLLGHRADLTCLAFSADGRYVFSGSHDRTVRQWEVDSGIELRRFKLVSSPLGIACTPDGKTLLTISQAEGLVNWNITAPPLPFTGQPRASDLNDAWKKLSSTNYDDRCAAFAYYVENRDGSAAADLIKRLQAPKNAAVAAEVQKWVDQLDDANYQLRLNAFEELGQHGADAREALAVAALTHASAEVRVRAVRLLNTIGGVADFRNVLAIEILATLGTPETKTELARMAAANLPCSAHAKSKLK